jgi:hypothetical protein
MNDQDHSLSLSDPDRSLVLSHLLVNFLKNLVSCQTSFGSNFCTFSNCSAAFARHYQYPILHNREFRSLGNRKNYLKSTTATPHGVGNFATKHYYEIKIQVSSPPPFNGMLSLPVITPTCP